MKIKKIELFNIGPYLGQNIFDLTTDSKKNIVLLPIENNNGNDVFKDIIRVKCPKGKLGLHIQEIMITNSYYEENVLNRYHKWK